MHEVLVNSLGGLSLPRKSVVRLTDPPDMTLDVNHGRKTTIQQQQLKNANHFYPKITDGEMYIRRVGLLVKFLLSSVNTLTIIQLFHCGFYILLLSTKQL